MSDELNKVSAMLDAIIDLSSGWDECGSIGPREPLSWESVGRMAMDYAKAAKRALSDSEKSP